MTSVTKTVFKVGDFVAWAKAGQLVLSPKFQRRSVWKPGAKSYLIDTVIKGLPVPIVFLRDRLSLRTVTTSREVVDGQQRLRTLLAFIKPSLLTDYDPKHDQFTITRNHNADLAGKSFNELPATIREKIIGYEIPVHVFSSDTGDGDVLQIFARLNSTGVKLSDQELRNAEYFGAFKTLCYNIAYKNLKYWTDWNIFSSSDIARMVEVEDVSDLLITMSQGIHGKTKAVINEFYRENDVSFPKAAALEKRFDAILSAINNALGSELTELQFSRRALFADMFSACYHLMYGIGSDLVLSRKPNALPSRFATRMRKLSEKLDTGDVNDEIAKSLRGATSDYGSRLLRVNFILQEFGHELG